jgi:hypothetical protein
MWSDAVEASPSVFERLDAVRRKRNDGHMNLRLLLSAFVLLLASASAFADVYRWTDSKGVTVFSSVPPEEGSDARNVVVVAKEKPRVLRGTRESAADQPPSNAEVLDRIDSLSRQVQAQQYAQAAVASVPQYDTAYPTGYYTTPAPSYYDPYYDPYYSSPYYSGYPYGYYPPVTVFVRPRAFFPHRTFVRPFVHGTFTHGTFAHGTFARGGTVGHSFARGGGGMRGGGGRR